MANTVGKVKRTTGITRKIDGVGRIVIPIDMCRALDIEPKDALEIFTDGNAILLKKYEPLCIFCGEDNHMIWHKGRNVCEKCLRELKRR